MRILVCGGRDYLDYITLSKTLDELVSKAADIDDVVVIQGGATGADFLAKVYCYCHNGGWSGLRCDEYKADWKTNGKAAGPIRNKRMLVEGEPDLVVACKGGRGTANMVQLAKDAGVEVLEI